MYGTEIELDENEKGSQIRGNVAAAMGVPGCEAGFTYIDPPRSRHGNRGGATAATP